MTTDLALPVPFDIPPDLTPVETARLVRAKAAYTTRFARRLFLESAGPYALQRSGTPRAGDVVLARVVEIGQHPRLEDPSGRRVALFVGDEILVAYGARYAPDQFEAEVPADLGPTRLVAAGGVAANVVSQHAEMLEATTLEPIGLVVDHAGVVNLQRCAPYSVAGAPTPRHPERVPTVAVLGTSMNSGKTTTVGSIVRGLSRAGLTVAAGKVTGTGAGGDPGVFADSGASRVLDFTDFGHPSTYLLPHEEIAGLTRAIRDELLLCSPDVVVLEVADGLFQRETAQLVADPAFGSMVDAVVFAAGEALGAVAGLERLRSLGLPVVAVSGLLTASPLATEEARGHLPVPVWGPEELAGPKAAALVPPVSPLPARPESARIHVAPSAEPVAV